MEIAPPNCRGKPFVKSVTRKTLFLIDSRTSRTPKRREYEDRCGQDVIYVSITVSDARELTEIVTGCRHNCWILTGYVKVDEYAN